MKARSTDPETSREAGQQAARFAASHQQIVLAVVRDRPGLTSAELAEHCRLTYYQIARRLGELPPSLVRRGKARECTITETPHITWWPIGDE